ncbi:hypothetical protein ABT158_30420 [Nonomuraea sp. NPDC001636]|uniref:hypothetical protein n=1 Tax=Nonomuraea sp. NPDC001636 TaxID=3154391 RepID=UPI0033186C1C
MSHRADIGFAVARELSASTRVAVRSWTSQGPGRPWRGNPAGIDGVLDALGGTW